MVANLMTQTPSKARRVKFGMMSQITRRIALIALLALLGAVSVEASVRYMVTASAYSSNDCSTGNAGGASYENGTRCSLVYNSGTQLYSDVMCTETGSPYGSICTESTCSSSCPYPVPDNTLGWGEPYCFSGSVPSFSVTCVQEVVPDVGPVAAEPIDMSPVEASPMVPSSPVPEEADTPATLIGNGNVTVGVWVSQNCPNAAFQTLSFYSNYSRCQPFTYSIYNFYFRFDCYTNQTTVGAYCDDAQCNDCTAFPSANSGECINASFSPVESVRIACPASPSAPSSTTSPSPSGEPSAPSANAASLQVVYASLSIIAAIALLML